MAEPAHIARRRVLFIPGFDPRPARAHRERYRREGARQAEIAGYSLTLRTDRDDPPGSWTATLRQDGRTSQARIEVLAWSDLVRDHMRQGVPLQGYLAMTQVAWTYLRSGAFGPMLRLRKGPVIAALYPIAVLLAQLIIAGAAGASVVFAARFAGGLAAGDALHAVALLLGPVTAIGVLRWFETHDGRILAHYLIRDYAYAAGDGGAYPASLSARLEAFTSRVTAGAQGNEEDELLLVGHSSGAYLAITVLADALREGAVPMGKRIALLTLGHVVPMVSFLPRAGRLRRDLAYLAASDRITWVDVTAPGDGCAFALCDPVAVSGVAPQGNRWPLVLSAAFTHSLAPETWRRLRWRFFRLHFQYMCAFDRPDAYDFFAITAGPLALADRFGARAPSPGRIETPVNRHTGLEP